MRDVLSTTQGKRVMWELMDMAGVGRKNFHSEPLAMSRQEGARALGLDIQTWATMAAPMQMMKMMQDNAEKIGLIEEEYQDDESSSETD